MKYDVEKMKNKMAVLLAMSIVTFFIGYYIAAAEAARVVKANLAAGTISTCEGTK